MGTYNSAVITNGGQSMIAQSVAGASLEFTTLKTSDYTYPAGTNLAALTTINSIKQTKDITGATVYNSRVIKVSAAVDNTGLSTAYAINTIGIYAKVGSAAETLFAVVTASAADTMPAYSNKPYSYIYEVNLTMQNAANVTVTVNSAGLVNVSDLNAAKVEIRGEIADLKSAISYTNDFFGDIITTDNYIDETAWVSGAYIKPKNGQIAAAARYSYQFVPIISSGSYVTLRPYVAFGTDASLLSLHDENKQYIKTITATSYTQSTGIAVFSISASDIITCKYIGISTFDGKRINLIKGEQYIDDKLLKGWTVDFAEHLKNNVIGACVVCDGDSICNGVRDLPDKLRGWWSRLVQTNTMTGENYAVNGATISYIDDTIHCVARTIDVIHSDYTPDEIDYLLLEGGTNDADRIGRIVFDTMPEKFGTWDDTDYSGNYNDTTFCGAVESLFYKALSYFPRSKIGFIIPMQMGGPTVSETTIKNRRAYFDEIVKIANKWHIPVLDLWNNSTMDARLSNFFDSSISGADNVSAGKYYYDGQHPTSKGYDFMQNKIQKWVESL